MSDLYVTVGFPGCGKTTWAEKQDMDHHSSDEIRKELNTLNNGVVFSEMRKRACESMDAGRNCIYDATNVSRKDRCEILRIAKKKKVNRVCILFLVPLSVCKMRNQQREDVVPDSVYDNMIRRFDVPLLDAEFDEIKIICDGELSTEEGEMLSDKYAMKFNQHSPFHSLTLGEHLKLTDELFMRESGGKYLTYVPEAARYHDIGKPFVFTFGEDGKGHFYGHEKIGAYYYLLIHFNDGDFWSHYYKTAVLINWHMRPYVWERNDKAKLRDMSVIDAYDADMYGQLISISKADRKAH